MFPSPVGYKYLDEQSWMTEPSAGGQLESASDLGEAHQQLQSLQPTTQDALSVEETTWQDQPRQPRPPPQRTSPTQRKISKQQLGKLSFMHLTADVKRLRRKFRRVGADTVARRWLMLIAASLLVGAATATLTGRTDHLFSACAIAFVVLLIARLSVISRSGATAVAAMPSTSSCAYCGARFSSTRSMLEHAQYECLSRPKGELDLAADDDVAASDCEADRIIADARANPLVVDIATAADAAIGVPVSPGNAWFALPNCLRELDFALRSSKGVVVVFSTETIAGVNHSRGNPCDFRNASKKWKLFAQSLQCVCRRAYAPEDFQRIRFATYNSLVEDLRMERKRVYDEYDSSAEFRQTVHEVTSSVLLNKQRSQSDDAVAKRAHYLLEEFALTTLVTKRTNTFLYPRDHPFSARWAERIFPDRARACWIATASHLQEGAGE